MARTKGAKDKTPRKNAKQNGDAKSHQTSMGHNSNLSEDQRAALFLHHVRAIEEAREAVEDAYTAADAAGITKKDINYALKLRKADDQQLVDRRKRENEIARWLNHPVGTQADLFDGAKVVANRHGEDGRVAGMEGKACKPPENLSQQDAAEWIEKWHAGNAARNEALAKSMEQKPSPEADGGAELGGQALESRATSEPAVT